MKNYKSNEPCCACGLSAENMVTFHHIQTRKSGGSDEAYNLMPLCLKHHNTIHQKGNSWMAENYPGVHKFLVKNGWQYCDFRKKWVRYDINT